MNSLTDDMKRLIISHIDHNDDVAALAAASSPRMRALVNEVRPISKKRSTRLSKLHAALPRSAALLRYHRQAHAAYTKGNLFVKMRAWQIPDTVSFSDHVEKTHHMIQASCRARRAPLLQKVCGVLVDAHAKGGRKEKKLLLEMIEFYIDDVLDDLLPGSSSVS
jgi:hypothetical protein